MTSRLIAGTINERESRGKAYSHANLMSAGFTAIDRDYSAGAAADPKNYNGGIVAKREGRLEKGEVLFRFSDSRRRKRDDKCSGLWWFDMECFKTIRSVGRTHNTSFTDTARSQLGVLFDWGDMRNLIAGELTADFWCFKGLSGPYSGTSRKGQVQHMSDSMRQDVIQLFIPGGLSRVHLKDICYDVLGSTLLP